MVDLPTVGRFVGGAGYAPLTVASLRALVMEAEADTRVIDPEFAFFGPIGFDVGALSPISCSAISRRTATLAKRRDCRHGAALMFASPIFFSWDRGDPFSFVLFKALQPNQSQHPASRKNGQTASASTP
jgi:hypothetical protein